MTIIIIGGYKYNKVTMETNGTVPLELRRSGTFR